MAKLHYRPTQEDIDDLDDGNSINAMTAEGVEVLAHPDSFPKKVWIALEHSNTVDLEMEVIGQHSTVTVEVSF